MPSRRPDARGIRTSGRRFALLAARQPGAEDVGMTPVTPSAPAPVTHGAALAFETIVRTEGDRASWRVHLEEDTLIRVVAGTAWLQVEDECDRLLGPGDEAIVPAGAPHRLSSAAGPARVLSALRPARG
jgi:quercetin dioxygenase-like cupin family protein